MHMNHQINQLIAITPLVVVPANQLYEVVVEADACACVEYGGAGFALKIKALSGID